MAWFQVVGEDADKRVWPWLEGCGAAFILMSYNEIHFWVEGLSIDQMRKQFPDFEWETDWLEPSVN